MKKWMIYFCAGILVIGLTACGKGAQGTENSGPDAEESAGGSQEDTSQAGDSEAADSSQEDIVDDTGDGTGAVWDEPTGWSEEMAELRQLVVDAVGEEAYWPDMQIEPDMLEAFYGITDDMYEDYMAEIPMISANVDTLIIVRAKEGQADTVLEMLNDYREAIINDTMQYPQNVGKIQASQVEQIGNYVIFVQLGGYAIESDETEEVITKCQEANRLALEAIRGRLE